jgi:hypothetical protein
MQDAIQAAIASFVVNGEPVLRGKRAPAWPKWGTDQNVVTIDETGVAIGESSVYETRCRWWQNRGL